VAGDVVVVDEPASQQNGRRTRDTTPLRAGPDEAAEVWDSLAAGAEVTIVELDGCARERSRLSECGWAYVFHPRGDGIFGYVPLSALVQASPDAAIAVTGGERKGTVPARDLLMVPEALGIDMPDRYTVIFRTGGPVPYFLDVSAQQVLRPVPREAVSRQPRRWTRPEHIVTSGPFHGVLWRARDRVEMVRSETFWGRATVKLARVTYLAVDDQATAVNLYFQGQCDVLVQNHIPSSYYPVLTGDSGGQKKRDYLRVPVLQTYFYLINVERHPNVHLRRALSHALDRRELALVTKGSVVGTPAYTPGLLVSELSDEERKLCGVEKDHPGTAMIVVAGELCYVPPLGPAFDLELAKKEWALAEQELGDKMPRTLTVRYNVGVEQHKLIAEWVQEQWRKHLGFRVEVETQDWQIFLDATRRRAYDVARFGAAGPYIDPENFMRTWLCAHPDNRAGWCNQEFQRLFLAADKEVDRRKRLELVRQAEKVMVDEVPIIPMALYSQHHLVKPYVRGYHVNLVDHQSLRGVWIDPDWAAK
jgi:ABC-type oligopeptide transport system substrate-binding subunit